MKIKTLLETHSHTDIERIRGEIVTILKRRATREELADALLNYVLRCMNMQKDNTE